MEIGIASFADMSLKGDPATVGAERINNLIEEIEYADQAGLDIFALGEHHRPDYAASAPTILLAAAAARTNRIKLSTAVTVLSSEDPIRVYQQFSTIDLLSKGRAEIMAGRGSFIESFPLFGYDLNDYDALFAEKLGLLLELNKSGTINWKGKFRAPLVDAGIYPRPYQPQIPIWVAAGGTPASAIRAANLGLPLMLAIIGGRLDQFVPFIDLYKNTWAQVQVNKPLQVGITCHSFLAPTAQQATDRFYAPYSEVFTRIGKERGWGSAMQRGQYEAMRSPMGSLMVGNSQEVIDKINYAKNLFGITRFLAQMTIGTIEQAHLLESIDIFAKEVIPNIR